jgi:hypothetical protein
MVSCGVITAAEVLGDLFEAQLGHCRESSILSEEKRSGLTGRRVDFTWE